MTSTPDPTQSHSGFAGSLGRVLLVLALFLLLLASVLLPDLSFGRLEERNFIYRDAGHFYYPYFKQIQNQWNDGRIPLWDPHDSGGLPLAANPTASVFYPPKLIFFALPYPAAYRWYLAGHLLLAAAIAYGAARGLGISPNGSILSALSFAFSGFVLFQIYNIVFLVGAVWLPLVLLAIDRLVRSPTIGWSLILGAALSLQILGGDPQIALLEGLAALPYWIFFHFGLRIGIYISLLTCCLGYGITAGLRHLPTLLAMVIGSGDAGQRETGMLTLWIASCVVGVLGIALLRRRLVAALQARDALALLLFGALLAGALSAIQILPTAELVRLTDRAAPEAPHEPVAFSFFPARVIEWLLPTFFGKQFPIHGRWLGLEPLEAGVWIPTIYMGLLPILLAAFSFRFRKGGPVTLWLTWTSFLMFWLALGKFGGVTWLVSDAGWAAVDPVRAEGKVTLGGQSDGLYWLCEQVIPGFRSFRYPSKILVLTTAGLALLAGLGLDRLCKRQMVWLMKVCSLIAVSSGVALISLWLLYHRLTEWLASRSDVNSFGPMDGDVAWMSIASSFAQLAAVSGVAAALLWFALRSVRWQSLLPALLLLLLAADLYWANRWLILSDLQSEIDRKPEVVKAIEAAEAERGDDQPFRVHRTRIYHPLRWHKDGSAERVIEMSRWERSTIQPKYGVLWGIDYTTTVGTMALYDVEFFFAPWVVPTPPELLAAQPGQTQMVYYPRQGYNLWNTRYFVVPKLIRLGDEERGIFTLLADENGVPGKVLAQSPADQDDYMVLENPEAFPRAWLVHSADVRPPIVGLSRDDRMMPMEQLLFRNRDGGTRLWRGTEHGAYPLHSTVMLETDRIDELSGHGSGAPPSPSESVQITSYSPDIVTLEVRARTAGFVVLADTYYPGWTATVDGSSVEILRANRAMRAIPVDAGTHTIVMRYHPQTFFIGALLSAIAWCAVILGGSIIGIRLVFRR